MSKCRAFHLIPLTSSTDENEFVEMRCDLDDGHDPLLSFHYDALLKLEWREHEDPVPVAATRTAKPSTGQASALRGKRGKS